MPLKRESTASAPQLGSLPAPSGKACYVVDLLIASDLTPLSRSKPQQTPHKVNRNGKSIDDHVSFGAL